MSDLSGCVCTSGRLFINVVPSSMISILLKQSNEGSAFPELAVVSNHPSEIPAMALKNYTMKLGYMSLRCRTGGQRESRDVSCFYQVLHILLE